MERDLFKQEETVSKSQSHKPKLNEGKQQNVQLHIQCTMINNTT
jgi:hypothetical protein